MKSLGHDEVGPFRVAHEQGEPKSSPLPKVCHTYPIMIKLGTVKPYLTEIQAIYKSRDTPL